MPPELIRRILFPTAAAIALLASSHAAPAQTPPPIPQLTAGEPVRPMPAPDLSPSVARLLTADYMTPNELRRTRLFHGIWEPADLDSPDTMAVAALVSGAIGEQTLDWSAVTTLDRAEASLLRGDLQPALDLAAAEIEAQPASIRARRIRVEALLALGRFDESASEAAAAISLLLSSDKPTAPDLVEAARILVARSQIVGSEAGRGMDFHAMMDLLAQARSTLDPLYWPARLAEAELLYSKDNREEANKAAMETLALNPSCARAWGLIGRLLVDGFNMDAARAVAARLDLIAGNFETLSPEAAIVRARADLRLRDADAAVASLEPVLALFPNHREALALRAAAEAVRYQFDAAEQLAQSFDRLGPGSPTALFEIGVALSEARQYEQASAYLQRAADALPNWSQPVIELGLLHMQSGEDDLALAALTRAAELDPFNVRADNSLRLAKKLVTYSIIENERFRVRYDPETDAVLAREMLPVLDEIYRVVTGNQPGGIAHQPSRATTIELLPNHKLFAVRITGMPGIHTIAASTGPVIAMEAPREGPNHLGTYDWERTVRHEFTHTVTLSRTQNRIPHWFTEAAAQHLELAPRDFNTCRLLAEALRTGSLFNLDEINIAFVRPKKPTDRAQGYAQGLWMYEYIVERFGPQAPLDLMDLYATGATESHAFDRVLAVSRDDLMRDFTAWARAQAESWGMLVPAGTPEVKRLLINEALKDPAAQTKALDALRERNQAAPDQPWTDALADKVEAEDLDLPDISPQLLDHWLTQYPDHPDLLEIAVGNALRAPPTLPTLPSPPAPPGSAERLTDSQIHLLNRYAAARPVDPLPHRLLAKHHLATPGSEHNAIPHLQFLDVREQTSPVYAAELAQRLALLNDWDAAHAKAERATRIAPYKPDYRELAATIAIKRDDFSAARRHIEALMLLEPTRSIHIRRLEALNELAAARAPAR